MFLFFFSPEIKHGFTLFQGYKSKKRHICHVFPFEWIMKLSFLKIFFLHFPLKSRLKDIYLCMCVYLWCVSSIKQITRTFSKNLTKSLFLATDSLKVVKPIGHVGSLNELYYSKPALWGRDSMRATNGAAVLDRTGQMDARFQPFFEQRLRQSLNE